MLLRRKGEVAPVADFPLDPIGLFVDALGHVLGRQVRLLCKQSLKLLGRLQLFRLGRHHAVLEAGDLGHDGGRIIALGLQLANLLGELVAPRLHFLPRRLRGPTLGIELNDNGCQRRQATLRPARVEGSWIVTNPFRVKHLAVELQIPDSAQLIGRNPGSVKARIRPL